MTPTTSFSSSSSSSSKRWNKWQSLTKKMADFTEKCCALWLHWESQLHTGGRPNPAGWMSGDVIASGRLTDDGDDDDDGGGSDDVSKLVVIKVSLQASFPSSCHRILSLEEHQVTVDGREVTMATVGLSPLRLSLVLTAVQSSEWEPETNFPPQLTTRCCHMPCLEEEMFLSASQSRHVQGAVIVVYIDYMTTCSWKGSLVGLSNQLKIHV